MKDFTCVRVEDIKEDVDCNSYIKINKKYILIGTPESPLTVEKIDGYKKKGLKDIYLEKENKSIKLKEDAKNILKKIYTSQMTKISEEDLNSTRVIVDNFISEIYSNPEIVDNIFDMRNVDRSFEMRAISCTSFCIAFSQFLSKEGDLAGENIDSFISDLSFASFLRDIGKKSIDLSILSKDVQTNLYDRREMQKHPLYSCKLIENSHFYNKNIGRIIMEHHENVNGTGYPNHKRGKDISYQGRILSIVDNFCEMIIEPYTFSVEKALEYLFIQDDRFDEEIVKRFFDMFKERLSFRKSK